MSHNVVLQSSSKIWSAVLPRTKTLFDVDELTYYGDLRCGIASSCTFPLSTLARS